VTLVMRSDRDPSACSGPDLPSKSRPRPRIETQIHRRKKAKALSELRPEWDQTEQNPPRHLRTPNDQMAPRQPDRSRH